MSNKTVELNAKLYEYLLSLSLSETKAQQSLRMQTAKLDSAAMQISPEQGQFMGLLIELMQAKSVLEIGTFTGYSALCMALALPQNGRLITCDHDHRWIEMAQTHWQQDQVAHKIQFKLGSALKSLDELIEAAEENAFDFAFIDADKGRYDQYYEYCLRLVRPGGLIVLDNVLWGGAVADPNDQDEATLSIRKINSKLKADSRIKLSMIPIGDGLSLALKKQYNSFI